MLSLLGPQASHKPPRSLSRGVRRYSQIQSVNPHSHLSSPTTHPWTHPKDAPNVADDEVVRLAAKRLHPLTLADLVRHGRPPLTPSALLDSANFTLSLLPIRLAHRIQALRNLPFIIVSNPHVSKIYNNYLHSLSILLPYTERRISTPEEETKFTESLAELVRTHSNTIPILARGFRECRKYISSTEITNFLDEHLRARIGTRLIAEQHIALHFSSQQQNPDRAEPASYIGVIDTALRPADVIRTCESFVGEICELKYGLRPSLVINGQPETTFAHVPVHLEYIITELLKNAFRATLAHGEAMEPIEVTIAAVPGEPDGKGPCESTGQGMVYRQLDSGMQTRVSATSSSASATSIHPLDTSTPGVTIRIRDRGGGIPPHLLQHIWSYSFTTFTEEQMSSSAPGGGVDALSALSGSGGEGSSLAGLGYGLPLGRAYAEYFGGGIGLQSLWGWGTDVYLRLHGIGKIV
ncbi:MAG: hypothetical protein M1819_001279 [Sarea resinae]|nr:MAG: hypothetical protein M1819_001279 [Sarea resinae]